MDRNCSTCKVNSALGAVECSECVQHDKWVPDDKVKFKEIFRKRNSLQVLETMRQEQEGYLRNQPPEDQARREVYALRITALTEGIKALRKQRCCGTCEHRLVSGGLKPCCDCGKYDLWEPEKEREEPKNA